MKKTSIILILIFFASSSCVIAQESFEGWIKFSTHINVPEDPSREFLNQLNEKYGDSLLMIYSRKGAFRRIYLNSGKNGMDSQFYFPQKAELLITENSSDEVMRLDISKNSLDLVEKRKVENQSIMNRDCECYEYLTTHEYFPEVLLTYCFSPIFPELNPEYFKNHEDFFINDFFNTSRSPYLKFSMDTGEFQLTYTATQFLETSLPEEVFDVGY